MMNEFRVREEVRHLKNGGIYIILEVPFENRRLEHCNESFYIYMEKPKNHEELYGNIKWSRCKSEMEDGRFEVIE